MAVSVGTRLAPSIFLQDDKAHRRAIAMWEREAHQGHLGNVGEVTLLPGTAMTAVVDFRVGPNSVISLMPTNANAAAAIPTIYITQRATETFTINHANTTTADRAFAYSILG